MRRPGRQGPRRPRIASKPMFPFWEVAIAPVLEAAGARRVVEIGALRGENTEQHARPPRPRRRAARHRPGAGLRPRGARARSSRVGTSSTATSASTCCRPAGRWTRRSSTATTTGTPSTTSCGMLARRGPHGRRAAAGHDHARRRLALRPPRPLLRPRDRSRPSSASRTRRPGMRPDRKKLLPTGRPQPDDVQRRASRAVRATA